MQTIASQNAPSPSVVVPHFAVGGLVLLAFTILLFFSAESLTQHFFNPKLLALTHLLVLGWITMIIFGALYQLIPVIMETKLFSELLAKISFVFLTVGTILLTYAFWNFRLGNFLIFAGSIITISVLLFLINVFFTTKSSTKKSIEKKFIFTSTIWLGFTVLMGLVLAINLSFPFLSTSHIELLKLHAHAGIAGWIIQLIIGVGSKILPMFLVAHGMNKKKLVFSYYAINSGLFVGIVSIYFAWGQVVIIATCVVVLGLLTFLSYLYEAFRLRVKKKLDPGMKQSIMSFLILLFPIFLVLLFSFDIDLISTFSITLSIVYGCCLMIGFITSLIMGQTYKTLPFIIWLKIYRGHVGKIKIPLPKELYSETIAIAQRWVFNSGFIVVIGGILLSEKDVIKFGCLFLILATLLYNFNLFKIIFHKQKKHATTSA